ncbi:hypothetical protein [Okeania sp. SIO2B3]|uniref:hypothetical protein n=1 Tax=Okeania sp. SIO2B3 TaxID=2607784 RepID=UPI0013C0ED80|nr:hypothetical protein [Okeania sp. SIO2B3]NET46345.1 hypothetical protein [Okeania sp. SIO2B3]
MQENRSQKKSDRSSHERRSLYEANKKNNRTKSQKKALALPAIGESDRAIVFLENRKPRFQLISSGY